MNKEELVLNEKTFSEMFDEYYSPLCLFANKFLNDIDLSRSLVQELFVDLWLKREKIKVRESIKFYLYKSVKNRSIDYLRELNRSVSISDISESKLHSPFVDKIEEAELNDRINQVISELPEKCREIFILCRFDGLKYSQIAEKLNISIKTVEMQMGIALKKIRSKISDIQYFKLLVAIFLKKK
ncbi:RNA polymerase sigma-70 factor [Sunxiuqinia sp. A32]|uniref:RNA polymerase sigma-70 factor n=1 Tax=Sunxiuqinia sp. A32 TaxID=3461496 RepID=UPI004045A96B